MDPRQEKAYLQEWLENVNMVERNYNALQEEENNYPHGFLLADHRKAFGEDTDSDVELEYHGGFSETSSSSTGSEHEHDPLNDSQTDQAKYRKKKVSFKTEHAEEVQEEKPVPDWFDLHGFQYHGRIFLLAVPGLLMVIVLGGDMLLTVVTIGALAVHLFHVAGSENKTFIAYLVAFICIQLTVLYSAVPLIWKSMLNALLVIWLNLYSVLTGTWLLLLFKGFRYREPELARFIESSLFSLYPAVCAALVTWMVAIFTSGSVAPYCLLLVGFALLQVFLSPTPSSFVKAGSTTQEESYILDPDLAAAVALFYCVSPTGLYLVSHVAWDVWSIMYTAVLIESAFLACLSVFLTTHLSWRPFMDKSGLPFEYILRSRWVSGLGALLLLGVVLHCWGVQSHLLSWVPVVLGLHALTAVLFLRKHGRTYTALAVLGVGIAYMLITLQLPWLMDYYINDSLHLNVIYALVIANAVLCLLCVYAASHFTHDLFGFLFLLQSLCTVILEKCLLSGSLIPYSYTVLLSALIIYTVIRLSRGFKLLWQHALLSLSLHLASVLTSVSSMTSEVIPPPSLGRSGYDFLASWGLCACLAQAVWFEKREVLSLRQVSSYMASIAVTGVLSAGSLSRLVSVLTSQPPEINSLAALVTGVVGATCLKLTTCHQCDWQYGKHVSVVTMATACVVVYARPSPTLSWEDTALSSALFSLLLGIGLISIVRKYKVTMATMMLPSTLVGLPLGFGLSALVYQTVVPPIVYVSVCSVTTLCLCLSLAVWLQPGACDRNVKMLLAVLSLVCASSLTLDLVQPAPDLTPKPGVMATCIGALGGAMVLKLHSLWNQGGHITTQGDLYISRLPLWGNLATCVCFITLVALCPVSECLAWVCLCSKVWFLLQKDNIFIHRKCKDSHLAPTVLTIAYTIMIMATYTSSLWTLKSPWIIFLGVIEVAMVLLAVPVYIILTSVLWNGTIVLSDRLVVFLLPVNSVLVLVGSTYTCWLHAACAFLACLWMMKYRLPLKVTR